MHFLGDSYYKQIAWIVSKLSFGTVLFCSVRYGTVLYGTVRYGTVRFCTVLYGTGRDGSVRFGSVRFCFATSTSSWQTIYCFYSQSSSGSYPSILPVAIMCSFSTRPIQTVMFRFHFAVRMMTSLFWFSVQGNIFHKLSCQWLLRMFLFLLST